jgi:hypothetical protein
MYFFPQEVDDSRRLTKFKEQMLYLNPPPPKGRRGKLLKIDKGTLPVQSGHLITKPILLR